MSFRSMAGTFHIQNLQCCWESRPAVSNALALKVKFEAGDVGADTPPLQLYLLLLPIPFVSFSDSPLGDREVFDGDEYLNVFAATEHSQKLFPPF